MTWHIMCSTATAGCAMKRYVDFLGTWYPAKILGLGGWGLIVEGWRTCFSSTRSYYYDAQIFYGRAGFSPGCGTKDIGTLAKQIRTAFNRRFFDPHHQEPGTHHNAFPICWYNAGMSRM